MKLRLRATGCHLSYGITQCYLPPDTPRLIPCRPGQYLIYVYPPKDV